MTESIAESHDNGNPLYLASLDVQKAFDVVSHPSMLRKLQAGGVTGQWWLLKQDLMNGMSGKVLWNGCLSDSYEIKQGNKQGGYCSPDEYKDYQLMLLVQIYDSEIGFSIGSIKVPCPTVADDMILAASSIHDLQSLLQMCETYANKERYIIHPEKSVITSFHLSKPYQEFIEEEKPFTINNENVSVKTDFTHVGIQRTARSLTNSTQPTVDARLSTARLTIHALMGIGLTITYYLPPIVSLHIYTIYVLPRLTYGLQVINLQKPDIKALEIQHRRFLYHMLHLPQQTATVALHSLTGILPLEAIIDIQRLSYFHHLLMSPGPLQDIIIRQWAMKDNNSYSWVITTKKLLTRYWLPDPLTTLGMSYSKLEWKKLVKRNVHRVWIQELELEMIEKSSPIYMKPDFKPNDVHIALQSLNDTEDIRRANNKWRMMTGTYATQQRRFKYKQSPSPICLLCRKEEEDLLHMIVRCEALSDVRKKYIPQIVQKFPGNEQIGIYANDSQLLQIIIDVSHPDIKNSFEAGAKTMEEIELMSQKFLFKMHQLRVDLLNAMTH